MKKILIILISFFCLINNVYAEEFPSVTCKKELFIDMKDNTVIYENRADEKSSIASITKVMTALVAIENIKDYNEKVVVTKDMIGNIGIDYVKVGYKAGDKPTYNDLLYGILLKSGADATNIVGISIGGSIDNYVKMMNDKAKELGMKDTHFTNTIGMDNENHYSTAKDIAKLLTYAYNNEKFKEVFTTSTYDILSLNTTLKGPISYMHSDKFNMPYIIGGKTGNTDNAKLCLATIAKNKNHMYLLVTLESDKKVMTQHMTDSKAIYEYFFNNYDYIKIYKKNDEILKLKTEYDEEIPINTNKDIIAYIDKNTDLKDLKYEFKGNKILKKGIKKNDKIGTYIISNKDRELYRTDIYAPKTVFITFDYFINHNKVLLICTGIILLLFILSIHKKRKRRRKRHR